MKTLLNLQITIFLLVAVGFLLKKLKIVSGEGRKCITDLVINVILPCNILKAFCMEFSGDLGAELITIFFLSVAVQVFTALYGKFVYRRAPENRQKSLRYGTIVSNAGFLGNPIAEGVFGAYGLLLASVYLIPQRIVMWSEGIAIYSGISDRKAAIKKAATHPCILACVLGTVLLVTGLRFPAPVMSAISYFGSCNTPMSMLIIGLILGDMDLKTLWDPTVALFSLRRLVVIPLIFYVLISFLPVSPVVGGVTVLLAAMPAAATTSILAAKYDTDPAYATKLVIFSTLLSLPTLMLWSLFLV